MAISQQLSVALTVIKQGLLLVRDAIGDITGRSLTYDSLRFIQPSHLNQRLRQHQANISQSQLLNIASLSSNCNNSIVQIEQTNATLPKPLPDTLFIKLPSPSLITRWFFAVIGSWQLETYFFQHVAQHTPIRTPRTFAAINQGSRFALIQENLHADNKVQLFSNLDMLQGPSLALSKRCLDTFARLHSAHCELSKAQQLAILPLDLHPFLSPTTAVIAKVLNQQALAPCLKKHPTLIPDHVIRSHHKTLQHWETLIDYWFSGPLSLLHGDSHLGNFFVSGDDMGMLDWQAVHWGNGIRDVQYFLINSLPIDVLASHEQELIAYYVERRAHYGSAIDLKQSRQQYRSFSFHTLMTIIVSIGFGAMNAEQNALMEEILKRAVAAIERLDYSDWLSTFLTKPHAAILIDC
ncbi:phosphotransferase [Oceanicoccus sp. KOV_DT_Chl]|uniref:phosphotransferase n=1 Tax=Oceanicoccus sp. KOV_DT_Chl TaxID=1904639 RepID=UPI000C797EF6|nr:phosphotransferase [Oceanicoccus sp. KOV_DT_Chl]